MGWLFAASIIVLQRYNQKLRLSKHHRSQRKQRCANREVDTLVPTESVHDAPKTPTVVGDHKTATQCEAKKVGTTSKMTKTTTTTTTTTEPIDRSKLKELLQERFDGDDAFWKSIADDTVTARTIGQSLLDDDDHLDRLLVARNYNPDTTVALFWEQVEFRTKYRPDRISPADISVALPSGAWRCCGCAKNGQVVSNYKLEHWNPQTYDDDIEKAMEEYTLYVCYFVELMLRCGQDTQQERFSLIFDLQGFYYGMVTQEKVRRMIARLIYVAQAQYPERLGRVYLVNAPFGFSTAWSLIQVLLDAKTASKIKFCTIPDLLEDIDESVLAVEYGGTHAAYPIPTDVIEKESVRIIQAQS